MWVFEKIYPFNWLLPMTCPIPSQYFHAGYQLSSATNHMLLIHHCHIFSEEKSRRSFAYMTKNIVPQLFPLILLLYSRRDTQDIISFESRHCFPTVYCLD